MSGRIRWFQTKVPAAKERHEEAEYAFRVLGESAVAAVPELIQIYQEDISPSSKHCAARALSHIGRGARAAAPVLLRDFSHTNADVRADAIGAIISTGGEPGVLVPALRTALKDTDFGVRFNAVSALGCFGDYAKPALPDLMGMLGDPGMADKVLISHVEDAVWNLAPEKVGKPLVVEEATPIITNGVTTEALKLTYSGERRTLFPSGTTVPAATQIRNSDPRPRLSIYRGASDSEEKDHFLGDFEVMGLPATGNGHNVSTKCLIVNGQIILCARDNDKNVFLEIRRVGK